MSALVLSCAICAAALRAPVADQIPLRVVWRADQPVRVPIGEDITRATLTLPPLPHQPNERVLMRFRARLVSKTFGGWNEYLAVVVNGKPAGPRTADGRPRLVNRAPMWFADWRGRHWMSMWRRRGGLPCMNLWFSHTWDDIDPRVLEPRDELYWYVLDITDLVRPDGPNVIEFVDTAIARYFGGLEKVRGHDMLIDPLEVGVVSLAELEKVSPVRQEKRQPCSGPSVAGAGWRAVACPGGGIQIDVAGQHFFIETSHRVLGRELKLTCAQRPERWQVSVKAEGGKLRITAQADRLELQRAAFPAAHRLIIEDRLINRSDEDLGVIVEHKLIASAGLRKVKLTGRDEVAVARPWGALNCTVHGRTDRAGLGALVLDDFFRAHMSCLALGNWINLRDEHFALPAREIYRFKLALYPADAKSKRPPTAAPEDPAGYWAFLNQVRRDIGVNFTIDGPFDFFNSRGELAKDPEKLRAYLKRKPIKIFAITPWFEYYNGPRYSRDEYKALLQQAMATIKKVKPDAICIAMMETNLVSVPLSWFKGTLPDDWGYGHYEKGKKWGKYGIAPPPEACRLIDQSPWGDSMLRDDKGRPLLDTWYILPPYGFVDLMVYPRPGNYRERHWLDQIRFVLDDIGLDGAYIDQFTMSRGTHAYDYGRWDGHTVDIDPETGRITKRYAYVATISAASRRRVVLSILRRGKTVVTNGPPASWKLQSLPIFRFMETQGYNVEGEGIPDQPVLSTGQLGSPIGLGHQWRWANSPQAGRCFIRTVIAHLRYGLTYYYYATKIPEGAGDYGAVTHMFPITPVQLGEGFIVGRERVVTCASKPFRLAWARRPKVLFFDENSRPRDGRAQISGKPGDWTIVPQLADFREVAVIE